MKQFFIILIVYSFGICNNLLNAQTICEGRQVVPIVTFDLCDYDPWVLVFEDNFDGNSLDLSKWQPITGVPRDFNFDKQKTWHLPENLVVNNGTLKIITKKLTTPYTGTWVIDRSTNPTTTKTSTFNYTTGELWTHQKFIYGKFETRIKIPKGKGFWPAFWTYCGNPWNEIDIFEFWNETTALGYYDPSKLSKIPNMTVHDDNDGTHRQCHISYTGVDFSQDFHTFAIIWEKDRIEWLVDGVVKRTDYRYYTTLGQITGCTIEAMQPYIMNIIYPTNPMTIVLNLAIQCGKNGKNEDNSPDNTTPFPSQMEVDWVRYYQRNSCSQDLNVTNSSQYPLEDQTFNVIVGENVTINCNYIVPSGQHLEMIAQNEIILKPGFQAQAGSTFTAKIDLEICASIPKSASLINIEDTANFETRSLVSDMNMQITEDIPENKEIKIFPNPNDGSFTIDFGNIEYVNFNIALASMEGKLVYSSEKLHSSTITINMKDRPNGVYILYLFNKLELNVITHKIIMQQ